MNIRVASGLLAAILAPFFVALGFIIWENTWKEASGSAFALNLFKCNLAFLGSLIVSIYSHITSDAQTWTYAFPIC